MTAAQSLTTLNAGTRQRRPALASPARRHSAPQSAPRDELRRHSGWEYGHVLSGKLDVQVMFETGALELGDSVNFESSTPHRLSNPCDEECVAIWVVVRRQTQP